jgi:hypothetical protein
MREYLDPSSYVFIGGFPIQRNRDLTLPANLPLSDTMLIRWTVRQMERGITIRDIPPAILSSTLEIKGFGILNADEYPINPSIQGAEKVQIISIDPSLPHELKFTQISNLVTNSVLEFYAYTGLDPNTNYQSNYLPIMGVNNPASTDPAALQAAIVAAIPQMAQAIGVQSGAAVQQALANQAVANESKNSRTLTPPPVIKAWSGDIKNHLILPSNLLRMGVSAAHPGKLISPTNTSDVYIAIGSPDNRDSTKYEYMMSAGGTYIVDSERDTLPMYMWLLPGKPDATITVTEYLP